MADLVVMRETAPGERRVAIVPSDVQRLAAIGATVAIGEGAGHAAGYTDDDYRAAGAQVGDISGHLSESALAVKVQAPTVEEVDRLPAKSALLSFLAPAAHLDVVARLRDRGLTVLSFDLVPRTSRAQALDALSSQASAAGYQAAVLAANRLGRMMPMLMTAAGTIPPAKVFVLGAGVAGLQAIATAKRLGASVSAYDIRPEAGEEIRSLGARSVELPIEATKGSGGY
ncbi:MAG TPA: NAD(P)(+) transhydrogenase (Re/Si-specific) subunit alpha, partial [Acidimicrobiales bacterium]|nr:NAD(P)(+) transhydrogenase (Re/Si-specific) subunit alpha [Acidimicrobiales bacterium]